MKGSENAMKGSENTMEGSENTRKGSENTRKGSDNCVLSTGSAHSAAAVVVTPAGESPPP